MQRGIYEISRTITETEHYVKKRQIKRTNNTRCRDEAKIKRQSEEIEDLKQKVKQSKKDMDQSIKLVQQPAVATASQTEATIQPVVEKVLEDIREKRKKFLDATQAQQQIDQLKEEIQQLEKVRITIKSLSLIHI